MPTAPSYGSHGGFWIYLGADANNDYQVSNFDYGAGTPALPDLAMVQKFVGGSMVDNVIFPTGYTQGGTYQITVTFSPTQVTIGRVRAAGRAEHIRYNAHFREYVSTW